MLVDYYDIGLFVNNYIIILIYKGKWNKLKNILEYI